MNHYICKNCGDYMTWGETVDYGTLCAECFNNYPDDLEFIDEPLDKKDNIGYTNFMEDTINDCSNN